MSRKLLIFIVAFTLVLIAFVVWWFTRPVAPPVSVNQPIEQNKEVTPVELQPWQTTSTQTTPATPEQVAQTNAKNVALRFQYSLSSPVDATAGNYAAQIIFTMTESPYLR